jgi:drug/metabolite transporter (DMT)-like permease
METLPEDLHASSSRVTSRQRAHAYRLVLLMVLLRPLGNLSLAWGMKHTASLLSPSTYASLLVIANPFVVGGIVLLVVTLLIRIATLSIADLSLVLPLTAVGYVLSTALGRFVLGEAVSRTQWMGTVLICLGASLVTSEQRVSTT